MKLSSFGFQKCCAGCKAYNRRLTYSVTVRLSTKSLYYFEKAMIITKVLEYKNTLTAGNLVGQIADRMKNKTINDTLLVPGSNLVLYSGVSSILVFTCTISVIKKCSAICNNLFMLLCFNFQPFVHIYIYNSIMCVYIYIHIRSLL